jgi:Ubiquitinol-cytochrome C reductase Fe-S subunit TAT signal
MPDSTRRGFLIMAGAGAAAVGAVAVASDASAAPATVKTADVTANGPLVAYVSDVHKGEISVLVGEREVIIHDRALVAKLAHAAS